MDGLDEIRARKLAALRESLQSKAETPIVLTDATFDEVVRSHRLVLVDFWAPWCGPCRYVGPHVEALARERADTVTVGKVNTDENPRTSGRFGVTSIPTLALFRDGKLVDAIIGAVPKAQLEAMVDRWI